VRSEPKHIDAVQAEQAFQSQSNRDLLMKAVRFERENIWKSLAFIDQACSVFTGSSGGIAAPITVRKSSQEFSRIFNEKSLSRPSQMGSHTPKS
jgi:hypothetical protein